MWKPLLIIATVVLGTQTTLETPAAAGSCQTSGHEIDPTLEGERRASFEQMPGAVQEGMDLHRREVGVDPDLEWPECSSSPSSWTCQGEGWFCQCIRPYGGGRWHCGCEFGEC